MKTNRRTFTKGLLGGLLGIPTLLKSPLTQASTKIETKVISNVKIDKVAKSKLTKKEIIELILYHEPIRYEGGIMDVRPSWKVNKNTLRSALNRMTKAELIVHAEEFYGLDFFTSIETE